MYQLEIDEFDYDFTDPDCSQLHNDLSNNPLGAFAEWQKAKEIFHESFSQVCLQIFMEDYNIASNPQDYECPNGQRVFQGVWGSCVQNWYQDYHGDPAHQNIGIRRYYQYKCSETCCTQELRICYNTTTQTTEVTESWYLQPGSLYCPGINSQPDPNADGWSPCMSNCGNE